MLLRISQDQTVVMTPVIDIINDRSLSFKSTFGFDADDIQVGVFNWDFQFEWQKQTEREIERRYNWPMDPNTVSIWLEYK